MNHSRVLFLILALLFLALPAAAMDIIPSATPTIQPTRVIVFVPVTTTATPSFGAISITSLPSGAMVIIDGATEGSTPFTLRTLTPGSHTLLLQLNGYQDYSTTFTIISGTLNQLTYTLTPLRQMGIIATTTSPPPSQTQTTVPTAGPETTGQSQATLTVLPTQIPVGLLTTVPTASPTPLPGIAQSSATSLKFPSYSFHPLVVTVGNVQKMPYLDTSSPYFAHQFGSTSEKNQLEMPVTISWLEVDQVNAPFRSYHGSDPSTHLNPSWSDHATIMISQNTTEQSVNFRWTTAEKGVTGALFQISRYPFPADPDHWQNKYVPGIVGSGQVMVVESQYDDSYEANFSLFDINFARAANRDPSLPPYFDGTVAIDTDQTGQGMVLDTARIPFLNTGITTKKVTLGPLSISVPVGLVSIPPGTLTQGELGNPNDGLLLTCADCTASRHFSLTGEMMSSTDQTFYVRVVPIHANGEAGEPTLPVTVTVTRPHPCPTNLGSEIRINPPSVRVLSFIPTLFTPDETYDTGPSYFVSIKDPDNCTTKTFVGGGLPSWNTNTFLGLSVPGPAQDPTTFNSSSPCYGFMFRAYGHVGYHWHAVPGEESHWYDFLPGFLKDFFNDMNFAINAISLTWSEVQMVAAKFTATILSYLLTGGQFKCENDPSCLNVIQSFQTAAMVYFGIPPTLPTYDELMDAGEEYLIQVTADQLGVGDIYADIPDNYKDDISSDTRDFASGLVEGQQSSEKDALANAVGSWFMPDPLFNSPHPATVMIRVYNPATNTQPTNRTTIQVTDSAGLYQPSQQMIVPPIAPGNGFAIPVILRENYEPFMNQADKCPPEYQNNDQYPCYMWLWLVHRNNDLNSPTADTFSVSVQDPNIMDGIGVPFALTNLDQTSDGKSLGSYLQFDSSVEGGACPVNAVIRYPQGWTMKLDTKTVNPGAWDKDVFTSPDEGLIQTNCTPAGAC